MSTDLQMNLKLKIFTLVAICVLMGCNQTYDKSFKENNQKFEVNRSRIKLIISDLERTYVKHWDRTKSQSIEVDSLNDSMRDALVDIGIGSIEFSPNINSVCNKDYMITLNVIEGWNIRTLRVVKLVYAPCEKRAQKNYHSYNGYNIDIWGQGDNWFLFSDTDFI